MPVGFVVVSVPPHTVEDELATVNPVGNVSLNATPASATVLAAELVIVNCNDVVALRAMLPGLKILAIEGGATTVNTAVLLIVPVPPSVEEIAPVALLLPPALVPITSTENVQLDPAAGAAVSLPPERLMVALPAVAVMVPLPQEPVMFGVAATATPEGRLSLNATPLKPPDVFALVRVKLNVLLPFNGMLVGLKPLLIVVGAITVRLALEVLPAPASAEVTCTLLFFTPAVVPVTFTENVQVDPATGEAVSVPPDKLTVPLPAVAAIVPLPQEPVRFGVAAITRPVGKLSANATPLNVLAVFGLLIEKLRVLLPFNGMLVGLSDLVIDTDWTTVKVATELVAEPQVTVNVARYL